MGRSLARPPQPASQHFVSPAAARPSSRVAPHCRSPAWGCFGHRCLCASAPRDFVSPSPKLCALGPCCGSVRDPQACLAAICHPPCQHGGKCKLPYKCACPSGWTGRSCQAGKGRFLLALFLHGGFSPWEVPASVGGLVGSRSLSKTAWTDTEEVEELRPAGARVALGQSNQLLPALRLVPSGEKITKSFHTHQNDPRSQEICTFGLAYLQVPFSIKNDGPCAHLHVLIVFRCAPGRQKSAVPFLQSSAGSLGPAKQASSWAVQLLRPALSQGMGGGGMRKAALSAGSLLPPWAWLNPSPLPQAWVSPLLP